MSKHYSEDDKTISFKMIFHALANGLKFHGIEGLTKSGSGSGRPVQ